jgi:O-antigen/teichoic acid export membrane protein
MNLNISKIKSFSSDTAWTILSQVVAALCNFGIVYFLALLMTQNEFGQYKLITTWLSIALGVGYAGYLYVLPQQIARGGNYHLGEILKTTFIKSLFTLVALLAFCAYYFYNQNINLSLGFLLAALAAPILSTSLLVNTYFLGKKDFKRICLYTNFVDISQFVFACGAAYFTQNFLVIIFFYFLSTIFSNLFIVYKTYQYDKAYKLNKNVAHENTGYVNDNKTVSKINLSSIILTFTSQIDKLLAFHILGGPALAIYSIVTALSDQARTPVKAISAVLLPRLAGKNLSFKRNLQIFGIITFICVLITIFLLVANPYIFTYLFPKYSSYLWYANLAAISVLTGGVSFLYQTAQIKDDFTTLNFYNNSTSFLQIILFGLSAISLNIVFFLISKILINTWGIIYLLFKLRKY